MDYEQEFTNWQTALSDTEFASELAAMDNKSKRDAFFGNLEFGTAGMRGIIGVGTNRMNIFTVRRATQGVADWLKNSGNADKGVAIAYDSRNMSAEFAKETALMFAKNGIKAYLYSTLHSVPQLSFTVLHLGCAAGVVITASHNPKEYNGYKVYGADGGQLAVADANEVTGFIEKCTDMFSLYPMPECEALEKGLLEYIGEEIDEAYYAKVKALSFNPDAVKKAASGVKIVYTPLHGSGNIPVRRILCDMGIDLNVVAEQELPDGSFPTVSAPNPESPDAFELAIPLADKIGADLIIATDPDCDRMGLAVRKSDGSFQVLTGNIIGCLLMDYVLKNSDTTNAFVCRSIVSTPMADKIAEHYGVEMRQVLTGFKYIAEQIKLSEQTGNGRFLFGFEESYGYLTGTFVRDKDAVIASMLAAEAACYYACEGKTLFDAINDLYKTYGYYHEKTVSITFQGALGAQKPARIVDFLRSNPLWYIFGFEVLTTKDFKAGLCIDMRSYESKKMDFPTTDMLCFEFEGGSLIFRPSGTEPKLKAYCTAVADTDEFALDCVNQIADSTLVFMDDLSNC